VAEAGVVIELEILSKNNVRIVLDAGGIPNFLHDN
jgi:hypothetical protein